MLAGFAEKEYTPAEGNMPGEIGPFWAKGTRTPLMGHAAVITSGDKSVMFVSMDIIFITVDLATRIKKKISERTGLPMENILLACTHTHTGCGTDYQCWLTPAEPDTAEYAGDRTVEAAVEAWENRIEVKYGVGLGYETRYSFNRDWYLTNGRLVCNPGYKGDDLLMAFDQVDHSVNVMRLDDMEGYPRCFIVNYANHPDNHKKRDKFSADYPGYLRLALRRRFGNDVVVVFLNGTCGDVNDMDFKNMTEVNTYRRHGLVPPEQIGEGLAETVAKINERIVMREGDLFINTRSEQHMTLRRFATEEMKKWAKKIADKQAAGEEVRDHTGEVARQYLLDESKYPKKVPIEIHVMQVGPWAVVGLPGEIYTRIGTRIKANSPFANTLVVELANGANGYISPDITQDCGAYEGIYSTIAFTGHGTVDVLVNGATKMLEEMHKEFLGAVLPEGRVVMHPVTDREK